MSEVCKWGSPVRLLCDTFSLVKDGRAPEEPQEVGNEPVK